MKKIKCLMSVGLTLCLLFCMASIVEAQQSTRTKKVDVETVKAKVQNGKVANFKARKAGLSDKKIATKKVGHKVAKLDMTALKAKVKANREQKNLSKKTKMKTLKKANFKPTHYQQKFEKRKTN